MKYRIAGVVLLGLCAMQAAHADLTMRHTFTCKFGSFLPPQALDAIKRQLGNRIPEGSTVEMKGDRVRASMGQMFTITDYAKGEITLVDPRTRRFAVVPLDGYAGKIVAAQKLPPITPEAQAIFESMNLDVKTSKTGQTATIHGIRTEENLMVISMELTAGLQMRSEIHNWTASVEELNRNPALSELAAYATRPKGGMDPVELVAKSLSGLPGGAGEKLRGPMQEMMKAAGGAVIRMQAATYVPAMAQIMTGDPSAEPVADIVMNLAELSMIPIPDSRFEVPAGFQTAALEDLLGTLFPAPEMAPPVVPKADIPNAGKERFRAANSPPAPGPGVYRAGNGVSPPRLVERHEPAYTEEARAARVEGTVLLYVEVRPDGAAGEIKVLRSLDPGLDQKALEAVRTWKFKPGMKDGQAVSVQAQIEVTFRLSP